MVKTINTCIPEHAYLYLCPIRNDECLGDKCMLWKKETKEIPNAGRGIEAIKPPQTELTGKGYCGLIK